MLGSLKLLRPLADKEMILRCVCSLFIQKVLENVNKYRIIHQRFTLFEETLETPQVNDVVDLD